MLTWKKSDYLTERKDYMKRIVITGATGFIGRALCEDLCKDYQVIGLSRDIRRASGLIGDFAEIFEWDGRTTGTWIRRRSFRRD